ncbi:hypothetical protein BLNAU_12407 [Blattamonas nauphoetae]|uniref:Uncharacterized protein n=1 Tax=Blattamonas nauphoetae TaxID=2049346 RepID=A0ABQ9XLF3_9EUKA|nr:hypothetical protein BLNAU_12407 [Blattamonas nauphoetae]
MATSKYTSQSSEINNVVDRTITAAEKTPIERFDELIASCSNSNEHDPPQCQRSLVALLRRDLNHMTIAEERTSLLHRFGVALSQQNCKDIEIESLASIVSSEEEMNTLFHSSGFSRSILQQVQLDLSKNHRLVQLAQLSELCPLVSVETLTEDLSSLFRDFLCEPQQYLGDNRNNPSSFQTFVDILCNAFLACTIIGLLSTISLSSSPLIDRFTESLLDPTFPLHSLLSTRSFTDPDSSFFRMASTNPTFFHRIVENDVGHILDTALSLTFQTVRIIPDDPSESHCVDFGRATQNWVVLLKAMAEVKVDLTLPTKRFNSLPSSLLIFLILSAASTNDELSTAAVSVFSTQFDLSKQRTETLLFATLRIIPKANSFIPGRAQINGGLHFDKESRSSICAEAGRCVKRSRSDFSAQELDNNFTMRFSYHFAGCLVNALHSTTTLPHAFPFFSDELCRSSQQPNVWNDPREKSPLAALTMLAEIAVSLAYHNSPRELNMSESDTERRDTNCIHLFPFLGQESQTTFLSLFNTFYKTHRNRLYHYLFRMVELLVEMATVNSYNTPISLLTRLKPVAELLSSVKPSTSQNGILTMRVSYFERSIIKKLKTAEGEERWKLVTQLVVVSMVDPDLPEELVKVENDAQALLVLSVHTIRSRSRLNFHLDTNLAAFSRVVEFTGRLNNLPLVAVALDHIADTIAILYLPPLAQLLFDVNMKQPLCENVLNALELMAVRRREGVEEGFVVEKDEITSQIVKSCLKVLRFLVSFQSFDPTPFINSLISLTVTADPSLINSILLVLQEIEERTRNTPTPFSISTTTASFRGIHQSSGTQQSLISIIASIILSTLVVKVQRLSLLLQGLNETLISDIVEATAENLCLVLEGRHYSPQQIFLTLNKIILPNDPADISASVFLPLAPFLTRILEIVVPMLPDNSGSSSDQDEHSQLLNIFLSLILSLIHTGTPYALSTPPLSSLLSILSIDLVRLDSIPSSLALYERFSNVFSLSKYRSNAQVRQVVLALCEEGMEDRSDQVLDWFSLDFLNLWTGANTYHSVDRDACVYEYHSYDREDSLDIDAGDDEMWYDQF